MTSQKIGELDEHCRLHNHSIVLCRTGTKNSRGKIVGVPTPEDGYPVGKLC